MKDNVEHTGKAFLGLTFNCCHCHDHKYDPITQEEYFRFRAFFEPLELRHDRVPGEPDPGPFPKYVYGSRVQADHLAAWSGSSTRSSTPRRSSTPAATRATSSPGRPPVPPGVPGVPGRRPARRSSRSTLPPTAWYPGLKPFVRQRGDRHGGEPAVDGRRGRQPRGRRRRAADAAAADAALAEAAPRLTTPSCRGRAGLAAGRAGRASRPTTPRRGRAAGGRGNADRQRGRSAERRPSAQAGAGSRRGRSTAGRAGRWHGEGRGRGRRRPRSRPPPRSRPSTRPGRRSATDSDRRTRRSAPSIPATSTRPAAGAGAVDHQPRQPADGPRRGQPHLALALRPAAGRDDPRLRPQRQAADATPSCSTGWPSS